MLTYSARSSADPGTAWELMARPDRWRQWAPHVRGAWGLGEPEVVAGSRGAVRLAPAIPVPARVTSKRAHRSWAWRVGLLTVVHRVEPRRGGCVVAIDLHAPGPLEIAARLSYGPVVALLVRNLARVAGSSSDA